MDTNTDWKWTALDLKDRLNVAIEALEFMTMPITSPTGKITVGELLEAMDNDYKKGKSALFRIREGLIQDDF